MLGKTPNLYIYRHWLHPEEYRRQVQAEQLAAQRRIAELPPALITRAEPKIAFTKSAVQKRSRGETEWQRVHRRRHHRTRHVGKATIIEPSPKCTGQPIDPEKL